MIYNTWNIGQTGAFYAMGPTTELSRLVAGMHLMVTVLPIIEIAPKGLEASTYELFTMVANSGRSLSSALGNIMLPLFNLNGITAETYHAVNAPIEEYNAHMARATWICIAFNVVSLLMYIG